jgi:hypothetical protein
MVDSVLSRILCEKAGIFRMKDQAAMHQCLDSFVRHSGMSEEAAMEHMAQRWEQYAACTIGLRWTYGSSLSFYLSGQWNRPEMWPWKDEMVQPGAKLPPISDSEFLEMERNIVGLTRAAAQAKKA